MTTPHLAIFLMALGLTLAAGCAADESVTPAPTLPADETPDPTQLLSVTPFPGGGVQPGGDMEPEIAVLVVEEGSWFLSPPGGPWDAMAGELTAREYVGGSEEPTCERLFALTGSLEDDPGCSGCLVVLRVEHRLQETLGACATQDLPDAQDVRYEGYIDADRQILLDYRSSGVWMPWYDANRTGDAITFQWSRSYGYLPPDEED